MEQNTNHRHCDGIGTVRSSQQTLARHRPSERTREREMKVGRGTDGSGRREREWRGVKMTLPIHPFQVFFVMRTPNTQLSTFPFHFSFLPSKSEDQRPDIQTQQKARYHFHHQIRKHPIVCVYTALSRLDTSFSETQTSLYIPGGALTWVQLAA